MVGFSCHLHIILSFRGVITSLFLNTAELHCCPELGGVTPLVLVGDIFAQYKSKGNAKKVNDSQIRCKGT